MAEEVENNLELRTFEQILYDDLLPEFCSDPTRNHPLSAFSGSASQVSEVDPRDFARAWAANLIQHRGRGLYRAPRSSASEQFFWQGLKREGQQKLWVEPVITVAALARLHFDHGWPLASLGLQSRDYAFDIVAFVENNDVEQIAGEVKKTATEAEHLIRLVHEFAQGEVTDPNELKGKELNAYRKLAALRIRKIPVILVVGPGGFSRVFSVEHGQDGSAIFRQGSKALLKRLSAKCVEREPRCTTSTTSPRARRPTSSSPGSSRLMSAT